MLPAGERGEGAITRWLPLSTRVTSAPRNVQRPQLVYLARVSGPLAKTASDDLFHEGYAQTE